MKAMTVIRGALRADSAAMAVLVGDIHLGEVDDGALRPHAVLEQIGGSDGLIQSGPDGFYRPVVRVYIRADNEADRATAGEHVHRVLHGFSGTYYGAVVQLIHRTSSNSDYQDQAKVYRQIDDYRVTYTLE